MSREREVTSEVSCGCLVQALPAALMRSMCPCAAPKDFNRLALDLEETAEVVEMTRRLFLKCRNVFSFHALVIFFTYTAYKLYSST